MLKTRVANEYLERAKLSLVLRDWDQREQCELTAFNTYKIDRCIDTDMEIQIGTEAARLPMG